MPLATFPHFVAVVKLEVIYCDGAHANGEKREHLAMESEMVARIVPPGDSHKAINWPPDGSDESIEQHIGAMGVVLCESIAELVGNMPGAMLVQAEEEE